MTPATEFPSGSVSAFWAHVDEWFDALTKIYGFTLDPYFEGNPSDRPSALTPEEDGLDASWANERVFVAPPQGPEHQKWLAKSHLEARDHGALVVCLTVASPGVDWWDWWSSQATEIIFPRARLKFVGDDTAPSFPAAILVFRPYAQTS